jgi:hypothetical protein
LQLNFRELLAHGRGEMRKQVATRAAADAEANHVARDGLVMRGLSSHLVNGSEGRRRIGQK